MAFFQAMPWHEGEDFMHESMHVPPDLDNPNVPMLSQQAARTLQQASLLAVGTIDSDLRPWTTVWGGSSGFARSLGQSIIGVRTPVAGRFDPVVESLVGTSVDGGIVKEEGTGRMVSGLTIDLATRKRVKLYGRMIAGALSTPEPDTSHDGNGPDTEIQLVARIEQTLGNCPKYINTKMITPAPATPELLSDSPLLSSDSISLITRADMFFLSSRQGTEDMDTNHRGGPPGFVRVLSNETSASLVWPEYSGNRLYQTLGNLKVTPLAGLCFPDFETGNVLYLTGKTEILIGPDAASILPRSNLAVKFDIIAARFVAKGLPFRGKPEEPSPYNPKVRYLKTERESGAAEEEQALNRAKLLTQVSLTPSISCFRFSLSNSATYTAGQYVTFDFSSHLDHGYSHMRDDDPKSINDDFVRTFTVSNPPGLPAKPSRNLDDDKFEIIIRKVGTATNFLAKHGSKDRGSSLEVDVKGFGGTFTVEQGQDETIGFVAGGVGITPLLSALPSLDSNRLVVLWSLRRADLGLARHVLDKHPEFGSSFSLFVTGPDDDKAAESEAELEKTGATVVRKRISADDVNSGKGESIKKWYLCTGAPMRETLLQWMGDKETVYEDFNF